MERHIASGYSRARWTAEPRRDYLGDKGISKDNYTRGFSPCLKNLTDDLAKGKSMALSDGTLSFMANTLLIERLPTVKSPGGLLGATDRD